MTKQRSIVANTRDIALGRAPIESSALQQLVNASMELKMQMHAAASPANSNAPQQSQSITTSNIDTGQAGPKSQR